MRISELNKIDKVTLSDWMVLENSGGTKKASVQEISNVVTNTFDEELNDISENGVKNKAIYFYVKKQDDFANILAQQAQGIYTGRNLADVFDGEISRYSNEWQWMKDRIDKGFYEGLFVCDYLTYTLAGETVEEQIAGICSYKGATYEGVDEHIDFISRDCMSTQEAWDRNGTNNGTAAIKAPYIASSIRTFLTQTLYAYMPTAIKDIIVDKRVSIETRYSASGSLQTSTAQTWDDMGKVWLPTEYEVFGTAIYGTKGYSESMAVRYPIFINHQGRIKKAGKNGANAYWWLATAGTLISDTICSVSHDGLACELYSNGRHYYPICFRIGK